MRLRRRLKASCLSLRRPALHPMAGMRSPFFLPLPTNKPFPETADNPTGPLFGTHFLKHYELKNVPGDSLLAACLSGWTQVGCMARLDAGGFFF